MAQFPNTTAADGIWTLKKVRRAILGDNWPALVPADEFFANTVLLLQGDTFLETMRYNIFGDASTNAHDITPVGGVHGTPFSPYNESWSVEFDGNGDTLNTPSDADFNLSSGDWTIEGWTYGITDNANERMFTLEGSSISYGLIRPSTGTGQLQWNHFGTAALITSSSGTAPANEWVHFALVSNSGTITLYVNGTSAGTTTTYPQNSNTQLTIAGSLLRYVNTSTNAYMSDFRVVKGTAVYTSNFTPSTTPLTDVSGTSLLTCNANRFIDTSSNDHTITVNGNPEIKGFSPFADTDTVTGSGYFDGSGDYLSLGSDAGWGFGSSDFTLEAWLYLTATPSSNGAIFETRPDSTEGNYIAMFIDSSDTRIGIYANSTVIAGNNAATRIKLNEWTHIAYTREGSSGTIYINGVSKATGTDNVSYVNSPLRLMRHAYGGNLTGYLANARIVKGTAVYTSAFTPPTSPLTAVSGTSLLTLQNRGANRNIGFIDSSHPTRKITRNGNVTQGSFSPFSQDEGKWGNYFEGSSDYLSVAADSSLAFGTGDLTIEFWVNYASASANYIFYDGRGTAVTNTGIAIFLNGSSVNVNAGTSGLFSETAPSANTWHHIALTRSGTSLRLFVDGTQVGSTVTNSTNFSTNYSVGIGAPLDSTYTASYSLEGYISNLRVVKGTAVYTSNFTPSTEPLTAITNTELLTCQSNRFVDNSSNAHSITVTGDTKVAPFSPFAPSTAYDPATKGGSMYSSLNGDRLTQEIPSFSTIGSGDFTIECWVYDNGNSNGGVFGLTDNSAYLDASAHIAIQLASNVIAFATPVGGFSQVNEPYNKYEWMHLVMERHSGTYTYYVNGKSIASGAEGNAYAGIRYLVLGAFYGSEYVHIGYISDFRITEGVAVYQGNFTPPTEPLNPLSGTSYLNNFTNAGIYDGTGRNVLETVGDAHVENSVKKYGTGSMQFDGTGDYLKTSKSEFGNLRGDFTIEFWAQFDALGTTRDIVGTASNAAFLGSGKSGWVVSWAASSSLLKFAFQSNNSWVFETSFSGTGISTGTWYHIAVVRSSGTIKLYLDGTASSTTISNSSDLISTDYGIHVGAGSTGTLPFDGYLDDLRITKGVARYTANFTPPAAKLEQQ